MTPDVMFNEIDRLADDLAGLLPALREQILAEPTIGGRPRQVLIVGQGDSFIAGLAAEMAFEAAGVSARSLRAQQFLNYTPGRRTSSNPPLIVGVSASGTTARVAEALSAARAQGAPTLAVTANEHSPVADAAAQRLIVQLPDKQRSPGIRTYQASLVALLALAGAFGGCDGWFEELEAMPNQVAATVLGVRQRSPAIAEQIAQAAAIMLAGTGPGYACALFGAAKLVEAAGLHATGHELEDWWHIDRFRSPPNLPLIIIAPPGRAHDRALELARGAHAIGRRVVLVCSQDDRAATEFGCDCLTVQGGPREPLSPLLYSIFGAAIAADVARGLGRIPFTGGAPASAV